MQQHQAKDDVACFLYGHICHAEFACFCLLAGKTVLGQLDTLSEMVLHKLFFSVLAIRWLVLMSYTYRIFEFCTG